MKLVKALAAAVLAFCTALACAADGDPPAAVGRLNHISGQVSFAPAQANEEWVAASLNRPITTGDRLWTDSGGRAEMHVGSLAVRMDSLTSVDVLNLDDRALQLRLAQGSASVRVRRAVAGEPVEIATPGGAVVLTRPGTYRVNVDPQGFATSVAVHGGGQAEIFGANGSFVVRDGEQAAIAGARQDVALAPAPDDFDRWAAQRDRREDRVAATRYVPAEMTGYEDLDEYGSWRSVPQYGAVWQPTAVPAGWAPYRYGHWVWVSPWGWTWVDDAPWGYAPSHYGRWVWLGRSWAWAPGRIAARPVYAPALVAFVGGPNFSVSIGAGSAPAVGWVPLGWREPYRPWYRASHAHVRDVNIANVTNVTNINNVNVRYVNRSAPSAVTVVSRENFVGARPVQRAALKVPPRTIAAAPVSAGAPVSAPATASLAQARPGARPPAEIRNREAMAVNAPPAASRLARRDGVEKGPHAAAANENERPRVRVIARQERVNPAGPASERQVKPGAQPETADLRERAPEKAGRFDDRKRAAAPPPAATARPTFDRAGRPQTAQSETRAAPAGAPEVQREQQAPQRAHVEEDRRAQQQQEAQRSAERQREAQRERRAADEQQARRAEQSAQARQKAGERAKAEAQRDAQGRAQDEARQREQVERAGQQAQQRSQQQGEQRARLEAEHQAQQRTQVEARQREAQQRAQQQADQRAQQQVEPRNRQQAEQQRAQVEARQHEAQQRTQAQQRAQQQAEHRARQQAEQQARQRSQDQARPQAQQEAQRERGGESHEKGARERPRADKSEKG